MTNFERHMELVACQADLRRATDEIRSFVTAIEAQVRAERALAVALATIARVEALAASWWQYPVYERDIDASVELRAALAEPTE